MKMEMNEGACGRLYWQAVTGCGPRNSSGVGSVMRNRSNTASSSALAMFQHTLDRAARLTLWDRVVVVAAQHHQDEVWSQLDGRPAGMVLLQPKNVDTAAGIFLPLT